MQTFTTLTTQTLTDSITQAQERIVYAAPGISLKIAQAITNFFAAREGCTINIILDPDPEVCRLGYGVLAAIEHLADVGIPVRKAEGLRIGVCIVDDAAWVFSPTPLFIEEERKDEQPNAVVVCLEQAQALINSLVPSPPAPPVSPCTSEVHPDAAPETLAPPSPEIGISVMRKEELQDMREDLAKRPPMKFDLSRRVRVYTGLVQFTELRLTGCHLSHHTISIPPKLLNLAADKEMKDRLKARFRLVDDKTFNLKEIEDEVAELRKTYTPSLGKRFGTVILRARKDDFNKAVERIQIKLKKFSETAKANLQKELDNCREQLIKTLLPGMMEHPPNELLHRITAAKPDEATARLYLNHELDRIMPSPDALIKEMTLTCDYKDVTYEVLNEKEFQAALRDKFPFEKFPNQPYTEFEAAKQGELPVEIRR